MKAAQGALAGLILVGLSAAILAGKQHVVAQEVPIALDDPEDIPADLPLSRNETVAEDAAAPAARPHVVAQAPEALDPEVAASTNRDDGELERVAPRPPLSDLALASPPKPPRQTKPEDWKGTPLFQPVAKAAGLIEAKGYSIAVSGVDIVGLDETCTDAGKEWACGQRARTAFRSFLRGRAVICKVPPENGRDIIAAECRIGRDDIGQWLVENGWARAAVGGPYMEVGRMAEAERKGIFGPPPERIRMTLSPGETSLPAPPPPSLEPALPAETLPAPADDNTSEPTLQAFPPAPRQ